EKGMGATTAPSPRRRVASGHADGASRCTNGMGMMVHPGWDSAGPRIARDPRGAGASEYASRRRQRIALGHDRMREPRAPRQMVRRIRQRIQDACRSVSAVVEFLSRVPRRGIAMTQDSVCSRGISPRVRFAAPLLGCVWLALLASPPPSVAQAFSELRAFDTGVGAVAVAIGDLNGDGRPDLATANLYANTVSVLLGSGAGGFGTHTDFA